ncbi:MAG TPA: hypothetical protein VMQ67_02015, partial [Candidatus Saccharimonadales bacterium]|nr:hypothetical protein [Candidatus Saccharimonadales bacterium]
GINTSGTIVLDATEARFLGYTSGITSNPTITGMNVVWTGGENGVVVGIAENNAPEEIGMTVRGISVYGADVAGVQAFRFGNGGGGPAWSTFANLSAAHVAIGYHIVGATQQCRFEWVTVRDVSSKGIYVEGKPGGGGVTTLWFDHWAIEGPVVSFAVGIDLGGASGQGGAMISFAKGVMEVPSGALGFNMAAGGPYNVYDNFIEGRPSNGTAFVVGKTGGYVESVNIFANFIQGGFITLFDMIGWRNVHIYNNALTAQNGGTLFLNAGRGSSTYGGDWWNNELAAGGAPVTEVTGGTAGFDLFETQNINSKTQPRPSYSFDGTAAVNRLTVPAGTVGVPSITFNGASTSGIYSSYIAGGNVAIAAGGTKVAEFAGGGELTLSPPSGQWVNLLLTGGAGVLARTSEAASLGAVKRNSPPFSMRGQYWNGSASKNFDCYMYTGIISTAPHGKVGIGCQGVDMLSVGDLGQVTFGPSASATFPMIKPVGPVLQFRLADDSNYGSLQVGSVSWSNQPLGGCTNATDWVVDESVNTKVTSASYTAAAPDVGGAVSGDCRLWVDDRRLYDRIGSSRRNDLRSLPSRGWHHRGGRQRQSPEGGCGGRRCWRRRYAPWLL